jgi:hypothetical protein
LSPHGITVRESRAACRWQGLYADYAPYPPNGVVCIFGNSRFHTSYRRGPASRVVAGILKSPNAEGGEAAMLGSFFHAPPPPSRLRNSESTEKSKPGQLFIIPSRRARLTIPAGERGVPRSNSARTQAEASALRAECSSTVRACSSETPGNHSTNWSTCAPSSRFSNSAAIGTRVPRNTQAPLTSSGSRSTAPQLDQSIIKPMLASPPHGG